MMNCDDSIKNVAVRREGDCYSAMLIFTDKGQKKLALRAIMAQENPHLPPF